MAQIEGEIAGWGNGSKWSDSDSHTLSRKLGEAFYGLGIRQVFGILGGGIAPFAHGLMQSPFQFFHFRHESGAGFAAIESYFESKIPALVVVTTGPGLFNALNAMAAARIDGAKIILVSGATTRANSGRGSVQETNMASIPDPYIFQSGGLFNFAAQPETQQELEFALSKIQVGLNSPAGFTAHISLPLNLQAQIVPPKVNLLQTQWTIRPPSPPAEDIQKSLEALYKTSCLFWVGHGARFASKSLLKLATASNTPVICSPRAKGVFDERHPLFAGVSGAGAHEQIQAYFSKHKPETVFVLGSRLSEVTSFFHSWSIPTRQWIQVDVDASAFSGGYPNSAPGFGIKSDCEIFLDQMAAQYEERQVAKERAVYDFRSSLEVFRIDPEENDGVRPAFLMQSIQDQAIHREDVVVLSEAGNSFTWCNHYLKFSRPHQYRTSAAWGSMGHFTAGAVGTSLAGNRIALAVVGDGSMLMNNEINTAVAYGARVIWVVLNDAQLGLNEHGMTALGMKPIETQLPRTDFVAFARSQGADGRSVEKEKDFQEALSWALNQNGPVVLDVRTDRKPVSPLLAIRSKSLQNQNQGK